MDEHRQRPRHRTLKAGKITFGFDASIDCTIRNLSDTRANLEIANQLGVPDIFTLVIPVEDSKRTCRIKWRSKQRIGVHFT
jgi:hypothetical protein